MPIFEYQCRQCGKTTELLIRKPEDEASAACEHCGSKQLQKRLSTCSVAVRGSGSNAPRCGADQPCCGADRACQTPPCA